MCKPNSNPMRKSGSSCSEHSTRSSGNVQTVKKVSCFFTMKVGNSSLIVSDFAIDVGKAEEQ